MNNIFDEKVFIIAEIGNNHEGSFDNAIKLIDQAKIANVDAVKFQTFKTENFISTNEKERFSKLKQFELSYEEFEKLSKYSKSKNLKFISTPFDIESATFLKKTAFTLIEGARPLATVSVNPAMAKREAVYDR